MLHSRQTQSPARSCVQMMFGAAFEEGKVVADAAATAKTAGVEGEGNTSDCVSEAEVVAACFLSS